MKKIVFAKLLESDLEKFEVVSAAKSIVDELQDISEKLAKIEADKIMPVIDNMTAFYGAEKTSQFNKAAVDSIRQVIDSVQQSKDQITKSIDVLEGKASNDMAGSSDHDEMPSMGAENDMAAGDEEAPDMGHDAHAEHDSGAALSDLLGGDETDNSPLGRAKKESIEYNAKVLRESSNPDMLIYAFYKKMGSAEIVAEAFGIDQEDVVAIVEGKTFKKNDDDDGDKKDRLKDYQFKKSDKNKKKSDFDKDLAEGKTFKKNDDEDGDKKDRLKDYQFKKSDKNKKKSDFDKDLAESAESRATAANSAANPLELRRLSAKYRTDDTNSELASGLKSWVEDFKAARKAGNVALAKQIKKNIEDKIVAKGLDAKLVWGTDPDLKEGKTFKKNDDEDGSKKDRFLAMKAKSAEKNKGKKEFDKDLAEGDENLSVIPGRAKHLGHIENMAKKGDPFKQSPKKSEKGVSEGKTFKKSDDDDGDKKDRTLSAQDAKKQGEKRRANFEKDLAEHMASSVKKKVTEADEATDQTTYHDQPTQGKLKVRFWGSQLGYGIQYMDEDGKWTSLVQKSRLPRAEWRANAHNWIVAQRKKGLQIEVEGFYFDKPLPVEDALMLDSINEDFGMFQKPATLEKFKLHPKGVRSKEEAEERSETDFLAHQGKLIEVPYVFVVKQGHVLQFNADASNPFLVKINVENNKANKWEDDGTLAPKWKVDIRKGNGIIPPEIKQAWVDGPAYYVVEKK